METSSCLSSIDFFHAKRTQVFRQPLLLIVGTPRAGCREQWAGVASPRIGGAKMFDFRRITLFCLEKRLSKHKMAIRSKNWGGMGPWLRSSQSLLSQHQQLTESAALWCHYNQGWPLADCFQSGPALRLLLTYANFIFCWSCLCSAGVGPTVFLSAGAVTNENQS